MLLPFFDSTGSRRGRRLDHGRRDIRAQLHHRDDNLWHTWRNNASPRVAVPVVWSYLRLCRRRARAQAANTCLDCHQRSIRHYR